MRNFIRDWKAFHQYAIDEELNEHEVVLFLGLFAIFNDAGWPDTLGITTNKLLANTTFTSSRRDDTLRDARQSLADRGVISFVKGEAYKSRAQYTINWSVIYNDTDSTCAYTSDRTSACTSDRTCADENPPYIQINENINEKENENPNRETVPVEVDPSVSSSSSSDDRMMTMEDSQLFDAAHDAGFRITRSSMDELKALRRKHGQEIVINAISTCVTYGSVNLLYLANVCQTMTDDMNGCQSMMDEWRQKHRTGAPPVSTLETEVDAECR